MVCLTLKSHFSSVTKIVFLTHINLVTPKAGAMHELRILLGFPLVLYIPWAGSERNNAVLSNFVMILSLLPPAGQIYLQNQFFRVLVP